MSHPESNDIPHNTSPLNQPKDDTLTPKTSEDLAIVKLDGYISSVHPEITEEERKKMEAYLIGDNLLSFIVKKDGIDYLSQYCIDWIEFRAQLITKRKILKQKIADMSESKQKLVDNIQINTRYGTKSLVLGKIIAAENLKNDFFETNGKAPSSIVYFGSGDDVETAVLSTADRIVLVDPHLNEEVMESMIHRIGAYAENITFDKNLNRISFNFEGKNYSVIIYKKTMQEFVDEAVKSGEKFDLVFLFNKLSGMPKAVAQKVLAEDGVILDNKE